MKAVKATARSGGRARRRRRALAGVLFCLFAFPHAAGASEEPDTIRARIEELQARQSETRQELAALGSAIELTDGTIEKLDAEIEALARDRDAVREAMIEAAARQKAIGVDLAVVEERIMALGEDEAGVRASLFERRGLLAEVLAALQRMGRKPPPALLVRPDDALSSVRSAILLGAVVPEIRSETDKLVLQLTELSRIRAAVDAEKARYTEALTEQREEEERLARLFAEKERLEAGSREALEEANRRAAELAGEATTLQELISALEGDLTAARDAEEASEKLAAERAEAARLAALEAEAEAARQAEAAAAEAEATRLAAHQDAAGRRAENEDTSDPSPDAAPAEADPAPADEIEVAALPPAAEPPSPPEPAYDIASLRRDMARLEPSAAFSTMKGTLVRPVIGEVMGRYGSDDGFGQPASGMTFRTRAGDLVTAPAEGSVLYSGPFRSYGQLLILNVGDGYHVVLAGMSDIGVEVGQFVLAGEPVAVMGARRLASAGGSEVPAVEPSLYVEFRKDGKPVDPAPWWADGSSGRTGNDS